LNFRGSALRDWEVDMLVRKRLKKLILTAANTLHSLGQLLDEITNIVVTEEVGDQVERSVAAIKAAIIEASEGKLDFAQSHAIEAFKSSEIAFHHPKNLKQLYFPDDQKYAIYIPLFLPVGIPVILSLKGIFRRIFAHWKAKQEKKKSKSD
jgi:phosphatidylinositol glycan class S